MYLQRLLRPDGSGRALEIAWSGFHSVEAVELINTRLGSICRLDPMGRGEYEDFALPQAMNIAIEARSELRHDQFPISVRVQGVTDPITKTIYAIAPESDFETLKSYISGLAVGRGNQDAHFVKGFDPNVDKETQPVGWINIANGETALFFTDEKMFSFFQRGLQSHQYMPSGTAACSRPVEQLNITEAKKPNA